MVSMPPAAGNGHSVRRSKTHGFLHRHSPFNPVNAGAFFSFSNNALSVFTKGVIPY